MRDFTKGTAMKTYTMIRTSGLKETYDFNYFISCKQVAQANYGQYEVVNNKTGKKCLIVSNSQTFKVYKWN